MLDRTRTGGAVTEVDREVLAGWTGWGALAAVFDPTVDREPFASTRTVLADRLSDVEWRAASASTLNAHYTDPVIVDTIWRLLDVAGFGGGRVLEPGCGSGLFIGLAPDTVRSRSRFVGVENDPVTARIAQGLYPAAQIRPVGFETVRDPDGSFDVAVGNVPFGKYRLFDPLHNPDRHSIHNHFLIKSLALVKPGGLVAAVTSRYTLDARNPAARRALHELGDLVAAIRLPSGAHRGAAGTDAVTDVVVFRRRQPGEVPAPFDWETTTDVPLDHDRVDGDAMVRVNRWFAPGAPGRVAGVLAVGRGLYGDNELLVDPPGDGLDVALEHIVTELAATVAGRYDPTPAAPVAHVDAPVDVDVAPLVVGELAVTAAGALVEHTERGPVAVTVGTRADRRQLTALVELRDAARTVLDAQSRPPTPNTVRVWDAARQSLNTVYDRYRMQWPPVNAFTLTSSGRRVPLVPRRFRCDPGWGLVSALEHFDPATGHAVKAAIFEQWLATPPRRYVGADTTAEALATCLATRRIVDIGYIADLLATDAVTVTAELIADGQIFAAHRGDGWEPAVSYLSGDVRARLGDARRLVAGDARYQTNVTALEAVVPEWLPAEAISARLGAGWIPAADVR